MIQPPPKKQKTDFLNSIYIASPCEIQWKDMDGDDQVRFCESCKKNVFNIAAMSTDDAVKLLTDKNKERPCIKLYKRADGTLITDDCPVGLRKVRERCVKIAVRSLVFIGLSVLAQKVQAQGLIGAPINPQYTTRSAEEWATMVTTTHGMYATFSLWHLSQSRQSSASQV
jgi:hypothetical protein